MKFATGECHECMAIGDLSRPVLQYGSAWR
jgi:hypothetical protein